MIKRMDLGWITVSDYARAKKFFTETLGLQIIADAPEWNWMELQGSEGGASLGIGASTDTESQDYKLVPPGSNTIMTLTVEDLVVAQKALSAKGVKFLGDIVEVPGHVKMLFFVDPDGNKFQLVQTLDEQTHESCC